MKWSYICSQLSFRLESQMKTAVMFLQADAVADAEHRGVPVEHAMLDRIRRASTTPQLAMDFFARMLHPVPEKRMSMVDAYGHPYLREAVELLEVQQPLFCAAAATPLKDITNVMQRPDKAYVKGQR